MCTDFIPHDNVLEPSDLDPASVSQSTVNSNRYQSFINSACFKYTKIILIIIYALNIVAWGGMLFLILVGAANKTMSDEYTRKVWIEIDSQILNALFCVTGIGLIPWRVRDLYLLYSKKHRRKLLQRHSYTTNLCWIQIVVWTFIINSFFQIGMAVCMWSMDMYTRPAWLVGLFVGLGCGSGAFAVHIFLHISDASQCSKLNLTPLNTNSDDNYSILIERFQSSNIIKVSVIVQQPVSSTSWFLMGASNYSELIGSWQPITSADGEMIECSVFSEQAVTNQKSSLENPNRSEFTFYWMAPPSFSSIVIFVATIFDNSITNDNDSLRYIQSTPIEIKQTQGSDRYQDVDRTFCNSSPCLNGGTCSFDNQYSYCQCVAPWNGVFCNLQYFHLMLESTLPFNSDFYFNTLGSPSYARLSTDLFAWLNNAFNTLPSDRMFSINFVSPSPTGTYISVSMAVTPAGVSYSSVILSALVTALARSNTTSLGYQLSINPANIIEPVMQDSTPYTSCVFPFTLALVDYNFCIPIAPNFVCSRSRVIDRNTTLNSLDCSRDIFEYVTKEPCFPNICLNGGTCTIVNGLATCNCPEYFTGTRCDQLYGCNPVTNPRAITCTNEATCRNNICICTSNNTVGTLCEIVSGNTGCSFPFTYMDITYTSCAVISGQSLCVVRNSGINGLFPISLAGCGAPQCQNNPCGDRGTCQDTVSGSFRCINCATGYSGYFCELEYQTVQMTLNVSYIPDYQNLSSNASQQLQALINQTLNVALINITNGGARPDIVSLIGNPDGTTSAIVNVNTNYLNFLNNSTQTALNNLPGITVVPVNTTRECAPWYIYEGRNVTGCVTNPFDVPICSLTDNFDRDGQFTACSEPINLNLCNNMFCGDGRCVVTSRNLTFCQCPNGITGENCDQLIRCNDINCLNNGTCMTLSTGYYRCVCPPGYGGTFCQYNIIGCVFPFVDNQNRTHNTCITTSDYLGGTVPWCRNILGQPKSCLIDYCAQRPCIYGTCIPTNRWAFGSSYPSFICNCTDGFTGMLCTHAYFRLKSLYLVPNISATTLNALESPTTQTYQNISRMFRDLVRNRTNSSFDFLPLIYTTFRNPTGNYYQISADLSYPGNISQTDVANILTPILTNLPPEFNATYIDNGLLEPDSIQPLNPAPNCTLPYMYNGQPLAVCHIDYNGLAYCAYGDSYTLIDRKLCDASGLPTEQYTACDILNITNPCNSTANFPIRCVAADDGWNCFCEVTQTLGRDCANLDFCRNGTILCRNNATCINRPDLRDFSCNCTDLYYGRYCENFAIAYKLFLLNYSNETSPGIPMLIAILNETIINITNGSVIATNIIITPTGEVTVVLSGKNYSVPQLQLPLIDLVNKNWTVGPYLVSFNHTSVVAIDTNATCIFPFAYNGVNYTTCITTGYGFPWCSATPVFTGRIIDCRNIDWCASGPCMHNGTCTVNQELGTFQCKCVDGWMGVQCAYPSTTITVVIPIGNNTINNITYIDISKLLPNTTNGTINIDNIRPGPNNTIIITIVVNGSNVPNITWPNIINVTVEPTKNIDGCVFPFIYHNRTYSTCIPIGGNRLTYCCQNANCDLNPQWQLCNDSNVCAACAPNAGCTMSELGVISCLCPVGFGGDLCETPLDLCAQSNRSCLNNGVCIVNPNTSLAFCNCSSPGYTGTQCETFVPCLSSPCLHNGTCSASMNGTVQCNCTNCYSGPYCQNIDYCCLNVCSPNAMCLPELNGTYVCICLPNYTGVNCSILNSCTSLPCQNNGTCVITNGSNYVCLCPTGWTGMNCDTPPNPCASLPCHNNGTCVITNGSNYECLCPTGWTGMNCDTPPNPCASLPCHNNGTCVITNGSNYECLCSTGWTGMNCDTPPNPCASLPCHNNGTCVITNGSNYVCLCPTGWTGMNCDTPPVNPCASLPCHNNGTCVITNGSNYVCLCPTGWTGMNCDTPPVNPCASLPCQNNGTCVIINGSNYECLCPTGWTGMNCNIPVNPCASLPCQNNGTCVITNGSNYECLCPTGWTGMNCDTPINPCASFPCRNNGQCLSFGDQFFCACLLGFNGTYCEIPISPCESNPCLNNGTCYEQITNSSFSITGSYLGYICICNPALYSGIRCENIVPPCPTNPALPSPCRNGGTCVPSPDGQTFNCFCAFPYSGTSCDQMIDACTSNPCSPNGQCYLDLVTSSFICVCINSTHTGPLCQNLTNPCLSSPCLNGSTCITNETNFICQCLPNRTGIYCENFLPPCTNTTCFNNGTCLYSSTTVTCLCPPLFTGPQCLQPIDLCFPSPCLNNGTCRISLLNTISCSCPTLWTGTLCETLVNPCLTQPCFFGGTCLLNSAYQPFCICTPTQTGLYCLEPINPCSSQPCYNNGTCISNSAQTTYTCTCPILYTGYRCENLINPCLPNRCIFGTCYSLNNGTYYCACSANYTGLICDHPIDQCSLLPCVNNGTCINLGTTYSCVCPTGYIGSSCEQIINPCLSNPCRTGTCYSTGIRYICACDASHTGNLCEIPLDSCLSYPCLNNQTCLHSGTNTSYTCLCALPYTGQRCEITILPCTTMICLNGGTCFQTTLLTSQCLCPIGYSGTYCELVSNPCQSQPCFNNGTCLSTLNNTYMCNCLSSYTGTHCEQYNPCMNFTCMNGGTCVISLSAIGGRTCICTPTYTGQLCAIPISPCLSSPCVNNGICVTVLGTVNFTCTCTPVYTGIFCEIYINPCLNYSCANGGTCYRTIDGTPICSCLSDFTGPQCLIRIDPCLSGPCLNNGICSSLLPIYNYTCICPSNYTGYRCENFLGSCSPTFCQNGGTCVFNGLNAISCICLPEWTGTSCTQRVDPCTTSNPCLNSGRCIAIFNSTNSTIIACQCLATFTGQYCQTPISPCQMLPCVNGQCLLRADGSAICYCNSQWTGAACDVLIPPCASQPCLNNGVCYSIGMNYTCMCLQGYSGLRCEIVSPTLCTLICSNNGTCAIRGQDNTQICICPTGYTGIRCEVQISPCMPSPCLNNGVCLPATYANGTLGFQCICTVPYTGPICATYIPLVCGNSTCLNGGTCLMNGNQTICQCSSLFTGIHCESLINPCDSQPCVNGGTCYTAGVGRKKRQTMTTAGFYCQCPSSYTGTRCESYVSLCGSNPCQHNGTCYQDLTLNMIYCLCTSNYTGTFCNTTMNATNICTTNPSICYNGGTCRVNSSVPLGFSCTCTATTTGYYCEQPLDECQMNPKPCVNNGTCVATITGYMCICPNGFTGTNCSIATNPCNSQPCFRNGTCLALGTQSYTCTCPTGYFGTRCEICDCPCQIYPCINGGVCRSTASGGVVCTCPSGYTGVRCEISLLPCDSNPCLNGGVCLYDPTTLAMTCQCCGLATGRFYETLLNPCNTSIPYCFNGGTCFLNATMKPMCICPSTFTGVYCETYSNPCSLVTCISGTCVMLANSTFLCLCPTGRSGRYCEIVDPCLTTSGTMGPCRNGGTCIRLTSTTYTCLCPAGFTGAYCDIANPCSSMPCAGNATCATLLNSSAICICPVGMTGSRCDQPISSPFCSSSPCRHNGTCIGTICICPNNTSGPTCNEIVAPCPTNFRPTLVCFNGGTCVPNIGCFCDAGFAGDDCSTPIFDSCTSSTCLNGGTCVQLFNSTLICTCPIGYTGSRCETYTSLCLPNPCQSNGTCIPSGTTGYICICPPNFTGPQCNLVTNPCLYLPCLNNGTCVPLQTGDYRCICLSTFTGTQCQTILNPCLSMPCNTGTCVSINNGLAYICNCPPQLTGPTCLIANPCGVQPCLNSGTCILTGASTYTCVCPINYTGTNCQTYNLCLPNPCLNNGTCSMLTTSTISCLCTTTYYGDRCQILNPCQNPICIHGMCQINPVTLTAQCACYAGWTGTYCDTLIACSSNPCIYGTCVPSSTSGYVCNCIAGYYGPQCQYPIIQTPCDSGPCRNNGACQVGMNGYTCLCPAYYVGINCEYINPCVLIGAPSSCQSVLTPSGNYTCSCSTDPCSSNPCQYGTCIIINSGLAYRCICYQNYLGVHCDLPDPCSLTTCYNGGRCIATVNNDSTQVTQSCQCPSSQYFIGAFCEHYNPCISSPCLNNATCTAYVNITCFYQCICPMGYSGERCQYSIAQIRCESVNVPNNCRNGGTCMLIGMSTQCFCTSLYTGTLCENIADICSLRVCQNGGTCLIVNDTNVRCQCLPSYQGTYCEYSTDPCSVQPCFNGGQCIASFLTFTCNCAQTMYTGPRCETLISSPCRTNPCLNGGTCQIVGSSYVCLCPTTFTGLICAQTINICSTIQCLNGGTCLDYGTFPICNCLINYTGDRCQYINQCYPNPPCLSGGTCIPVLYSFSCQCPAGRTGTTCQFLADDPCAGGNYRCLNDGTCIILSGTSQASCLCSTNFTGEQCEQIVSPISITTTTTLSSSILTIISESSSMIIGTTSSNYLNMTSAPYACGDISLACLAYGAYCAREIEFSGIPCRVLCPRTCNTCCEDFYIDGTCSLEKCQLNPQLECYCRKSCICKI